MATSAPRARGWTPDPPQNAPEAIVRPAAAGIPTDNPDAARRTLDRAAWQSGGYPVQGPGFDRIEFPDRPQEEHVDVGFNQPTPTKGIEHSSVNGRPAELLTSTQTQRDRRMRHDKQRARHRQVHPTEPVHPDTVLLRRELRWTAAAMLALGIYGYTEAGTVAGAVGAGAGYLIQQSSYRIMVLVLWSGWSTRFITAESGVSTEDIKRRALRAFTLWMRGAGLFDRVYVALWNLNTPGSEDGVKGLAGLPVEYRVWLAYERADLLGRHPLRCDNLTRRQLRRSLQRDEAILLHLATGKKVEETRW